MDTKFEGFPEEGERIVYIRPIAAAELPDEIRAQIGDVETLYSVNRPDGERVALVRDRSLAFLLARHHDLAPVNAH